MYLFDGKKQSTAYIDPSYHKAEYSIQMILDYLRYPAPKSMPVSQLINPVIKNNSLSSKKPPFNFSMYNLKTGDTIYLKDNPNIIAVIVNATEVSYQGKKYKLPPLAMKLLNHSKPL